jgi:hypothetical protein
MKDEARGESCAWGGASVALPVAGLLVGFLFVSGAAKGVGGDMAGGALIYGGAALGVVSLIGLCAAIVSLIKKEKWPLLGIIGILLNLPAVGYGLLLLLWRLMK